MGLFFLFSLSRYLSTPFAYFTQGANSERWQIPRKGKVCCCLQQAAAQNTNDPPSLQESRDLALASHAVVMAALPGRTAGALAARGAARLGYLQH